MDNKKYKYSEYLEISETFNDWLKEVPFNFWIKGIKVNRIDLLLLYLKIL